jgi:hypothetical protein
MAQEPSPAPAAAGSEVQLPDIEGLEELLGSPTPAPPFIPADASAQPPASNKDAQAQQQEQQQSEAEGKVKVSLMGRGIWHAKGKVSFPSDPQVPPAAVNLAPSGFCDPNLGLEPTDDGRCVCAQGKGLCGRIFWRESEHMDRSRSGSNVYVTYVQQQTAWTAQLGCAALRINMHAV